MLHECSELEQLSTDMLSESNWGGDLSMRGIGRTKGGGGWGGLLQQQLTALSRVVYKSMNKSRTSEDRSNKATLLLTVLCSLLSRLQRIYRSQYFD